MASTALRHTVIHSIAVRTFIFESKLHSKWCHPSAQTLGSRKKNGVIRVADTGIQKT
ncbi:hypothetical protein [Wolbachia endosymbiont (group A) of Volucella inflata]|uniref:hypothetical protein n=1 Tax=Wolbachia endosymbiont (group A) of Volucella inflata TaxID=2954065 RepID=UPI0022260C95|nr:hypothetical protein [Wolbachia endosymbiont (group A) of Volucella inflata]